MFRIQKRCSFCRRRDSEVAKLVAGPMKVSGRVYMCDRCATQAVAIMEAAGDVANPPEHP